MENQFLGRAQADSQLGAVPIHMLQGIERYLVHGIAPGSFLTAVLENDLQGALGRADDQNRRLVWEYVYALHNFAPSNAWGSPERVADWLQAKSQEREAA